MSRKKTLAKIAAIQEQISLQANEIKEYGLTTNWTVYATDAIIKSYTVHIVQSNHQNITVQCNGVNYTSDFSAPYGSTYQVSVHPDTGYVAGEASIYNGTVTDNITISAVEATKMKFTISYGYINTDHQKVTIYLDDVDITDGGVTEAEYGQTYRVVVEPDTGYSAGSVLPGTEGTIDSNITFEVAPADTKAFNLTLHYDGTAHQTASVMINGVNTTYNSRIDDETGFANEIYNVHTGDTYYVFMVVDEGYTYATSNPTNPNTGTISGDVTLNYSSPIPNTFTVTIEQSDHQTITAHWVKYDASASQDYTSTFHAQKGDTITTSIEAETGYSAGTVNIVQTTVETDLIINAEAATLKKYTLVIPDSGKEFSGKQKIIVTWDGVDHSVGTYEVEYGTVFNARIEAEDGYTSGVVTPKSGTVTKDITFIATNPSQNVYTLVVDGSENQTITINIVSNGVEKEYTVTEGGANYSVYYGDTFTVTDITPDEGYDAGTVEPMSGTITGDTIISVDDATIKIYDVTIKQTENQTITVTTDGEDHTESFKATHGTDYEATLVANESYDSGNLYVVPAYAATLNFDSVYSGFKFENEDLDDDGVHTYTYYGIYDLTYDHYTTSLDSIMGSATSTLESDSTYTINLKGAESPIIESNNGSIIINSLYFFTHLYDRGDNGQEFTYTSYMNITSEEDLSNKNVSIYIVGPFERKITTSLTKVADNEFTISDSSKTSSDDLMFAKLVENSDNKIEAYIWFE